MVDEIIQGVVTIATNPTRWIEIVLLITTNTSCQIGTVKASFNGAGIAAKYIYEIIQGVVTVLADSILQVKVAGFVTVQTCGQILTVKGILELSRHRS